VLASLGCGNPTALAELRPGERVLDLGSGGGIDVLLSARRVSPGGWAYGLDMTDEMLRWRARTRRRPAWKRGVSQGRDRTHPTADNAVDVIISNCVINLSGDKTRVLREAFRVLKPGGRLAVADVVSAARSREDPRKRFAVGGMRGRALSEDEYRAKLAAAGFEDIAIEPTRVLQRRGRAIVSGRAGHRSARHRGQVDGKFLSAFVRARKRVTPGDTAAVARKRLSSSSGTSRSGWRFRWWWECWRGGCCRGP